MVKKRIKDEKSFIEKADENFDTNAEKSNFDSIKDKGKCKLRSFSLEPDYDNRINKLSIRSRVVRTSRTDIIRAGVLALERMPDPEFEKILLEIKKV